MRAGRGSIGKVEVDCRFMFTRSPMSQPPDCKLESATITVKLSENDGEEARIQQRSACPVQLPTISARTTAPAVGKHKEKLVQTRGRWDFSGYILSTKDSMWYNVLRWELKESSLEWQPTHSNLFHTAFALEHNATRFYMTVHVSGKLAKLSQKIKDIKNQLKFGEKSGRTQEIRLDKYAQHLHAAMGYANMENVALHNDRPAYDLPHGADPAATQPGVGRFCRRPSASAPSPQLSTSPPAATKADEAEELSSSVTLVNSAVPTQADGEGIMWLGITAVPLSWLGQAGVLLLGLAGVVGLPSKTQSGTLKAERRNKSKVKSV
ncbi:hypothetical protein N657DRAFT_653447 [Parathielavia appendiculata]|uniref:Uncharacterized protein n=1 Tax=Parathielavia appendiculata TaxID=2587402 RepID=A0AAN6Z6N2_9PEZI|nr:hypothetical protein N657DRAFT_653447 [Parathielavia appendiculata]